MLEIALAKGLETIISFDFGEILSISVSFEMIGLLFHRIGFHCLLGEICLTLFSIVMAFSLIAGLYNIAQRLELEKAIELQMIDCAFWAD